MSTDFGQRLKKARKHARLTQKDLAPLAGMSQSNMSDLENTAHSSGYTVQLAAACGVNAHWLATGEGDMLGAGTKPADLDQRIRVRKPRPVWVVGRSQGGLPETIWSDGDYPAGATDQYAETSTPDDHAFLCAVVGDSMVPRYMPGEFALVEPGTVPEIEDDVLVRLATGETMLKRLLSRRGGVRLGSYNSARVHTFAEADITWMYYVAHPVPARRIQHREDLEAAQHERNRNHDDDVVQPEGRSEDQPDTNPGELDDGGGYKQPKPIGDPPRDARPEQRPLIIRNKA